MPRVAHRITPNRSRELRERLWALMAGYLAGRVICPACGATYDSYEDKCLTFDMGACAGSQRVDEAHERAKREVGLA